MISAPIVLAAAFAAQGALAQSAIKWAPLNGVETPHRTVPPSSEIASQLGSPTPIPDDLVLLEGKKVVVGRLALCLPNTFQPNLAYAGKTAKVVRFKPNKTLDGVNLEMMPANARAMMENMKKGGVLVLRFEDGTNLDTCAPQGSNQLSANLDLAPGETVSAPTVAQSPIFEPSTVGNARRDAAATPSVSAAQSCPIAVIKVSTGVSFGHLLVDTLTTSEFQRQIDQATHGGVDKHYLDVQVRNDSGRPVKAFEFSAAYMDKMGDESTSAAFVSQNNKPIRTGAIFKTSAMDRELLIQNGTGEVAVYVARVRFEDDSLWRDNGTHSCSLRASLK